MLTLRTRGDCLRSPTASLRLLSSLLLALRRCSCRRERYKGNPIPRRRSWERPPRAVSRRLAQLAARIHYVSVAAYQISCYRANSRPLNAPRGAISASLCLPYHYCCCLLGDSCLVSVESQLCINSVAYPIFIALDKSNVLA